MPSWNLEAAAGAPGASFLWRGVWSSALSYNPHDAVSASDGSSYVSKTNNQNKNPLSNPADWDLFASAGATGPTGATGATGPANVLTVSGTTTGAPGTNANVTIAGTTPAQSLAFTIPRGDVGPQGVNAYTLTTANFDLPAAGATVNVTVQDASWVTVGQMVVVQTAGGSPTEAYSLKVTAKAGNQLTLQNPVSAAATGDMLKSVYDTNSNGVVDLAGTAYGVGDAPIYTYQDHFLTGSDGTYGCWVASGTGAAKAQGTSTVDHPGIYQLTTGTSAGAAATGYAFMTAGNGYLYGTAPGTISFRAVFKAPATKPTSAAAALSKVYLGMGTQPANGTYPGADFCGFVFDPSSGMANAANNWGFLTRKASVNTFTDTGYVYSTANWADMVFWLDSTGVWFKAFTWATAVPAWGPQVSTNVPLGTTPLCLVLHVLNGPSGTTSYTSFLDLWEVAYQPTTAVASFRGAALITNS